MPQSSTGSFEAPMDLGEYANLLDPDYQLYVRQVDNWYPPGAADWPIGRQREVYDRMCRAFHAGRPAGVQVEDSSAGAISVRRYQRAGAPPAILLYFHGGGFVLGGLDSHDDICAEICAGTRLAVISVDYRLAPENPHPAAFDDACAAFDWVVSAYDLPVLLAGESAGGNLAAAVAHATRKHDRRPVGQILIYPSLGGAPDLRSRIDHANAPLLAAADIQAYRALRTAGAMPAATEDWRLEPLMDSDFSGLPPTLIVTADCDPLSSDGEAYRDRVLDAGGFAVWREEPRLTHSFLRARHSARRAGQAFQAILADVADMASAKLSNAR